MTRPVGQARGIASTKTHSASSLGLYRPVRERTCETLRRGDTMKITRRYTEAGKSPYATIPFRNALSEIKNPDGSTVFRLDGFMVPEHWSQVAADILAQKYFRKAGVPKRLRKVEETQVPSWLWRSVPDASRTRRSDRERACRQRDRCPPGFRPSRRHLDLLGLEGRLLHNGRGRPLPSSTSTATCLPCRWLLRTARNGSTPACTGPMASTALARATSMSITRRAR